MFHFFHFLFFIIIVCFHSFFVFDLTCFWNSLFIRFRSFTGLCANDSDENFYCQECFRYYLYNQDSTLNYCHGGLHCYVSVEKTQCLIFTLVWLVVKLPYCYYLYINFTFFNPIHYNCFSALELLNQAKQHFTFILSIQS